MFYGLIKQNRTHPKSFILKTSEHLMHSDTYIHRSGVIVIVLTMYIHKRHSRGREIEFCIFYNSIFLDANDGVVASLHPYWSSPFLIRNSTNYLGQICSINFQMPSFPNVIFWGIFPIIHYSLKILMYTSYLYTVKDKFQKRNWTVNFHAQSWIFSWKSFYKFENHE